MVAFPFEGGAASSHPVALLEQQHLASLLCHQSGHSQSADAGPDYDYVIVSDLETPPQCPSARAYNPVPIRELPIEF
jgi:hypothetical protein